MESLKFSEQEKRLIVQKVKMYFQEELDQDIRQRHRDERINVGGQLIRRCQ